MTKTIVGRKGFISVSSLWSVNKEARPALQAESAGTDTGGVSAAFSGLLASLAQVPLSHSPGPSAQGWQLP